MNARSMLGLAQRGTSQLELFKICKIVICKKTGEEVERRLECWMHTLERKGMKVDRSKTKYLCVNGGNDKETVKIEDTSTKSKRI